jgi:hypothetical protein
VIRTTTFLSLAVLLAACPPAINTGDGGMDNDITVGPMGGTFIRPGYGLVVPAGAFESEVTIFVRRAADDEIPEVPNRKRISLGYRLAPASLVPKVPLTLYLPWDPARLVAGVDPGTYDVRRKQGSEAYFALPGAKTFTLPSGPDGGPYDVMEAKTDKLGIFWVTSPTQPNIARLELDPPEANMRVGESIQFSARVVSPTGETIDTPVQWRVIPMRVLLTDASGLITALAPGVATVYATAGMQTATAQVTVRGETPGPGTFSHQNPFPTGNDLVGGSFAPAGLGTVYAGLNGTVLVEDMMGAWTRVFSTPAVELKAAGGTTLTNAVAIGQTAAGAGVLIEFKGSAMPPVARVFQPTQISDLAHLWFDGTHGMGVGQGNEVVIRRNGAWVTESHPSFEALTSVIGDGMGGFTVVGDLGSIYRWDPTRNVWDSLFDTRLAVKLDAAALLTPDGEAWAVGGNRLWHFTGAGWVAESLPTTPALLRATSLAVFDGRVFVGGEVRLGTPLPTSKGVVLVRAETAVADGGMGTEVTWTSFPLRALQVPRGLFGAGTEGRAVGTLGAVWKWNSATKDFTERSHGFQGDVADVAATETDVFAAVNECVDLRCLTRRGVVMHRTQNGFEPLGTFPTNETVKAIVARTDSEVIVSTQTGLLRWDGTGWTSVSIGAFAGPILDLAWCGTSLWASGDRGTVYKGDATLLDSAGAIGGGSPLEALHCPTANEIWVSGQEFLAVKTGQNAWSSRTSDTVNHAAWKAVWSPGAGEAFAFGDSYYGVYWDTQQLTSIEQTAPLVGIDVATSMWGATIDTLYMTGLLSAPAPLGFLMKFDGVNWTLVDSGASRKGTALTGRSTNEMWLGTEGGGVLKAVPPQ